MDTPTKKKALLEIEAEMLRLRQQLADMSGNQLLERSPPSPREGSCTKLDPKARRCSRSRAQLSPAAVLPNGHRIVEETKRTNSSPAHCRKRKDGCNSAPKPPRAMSAGYLEGSTAASGSGSDSDSTVTDHENGSQKRTFNGTVSISPQALRSFVTISTNQKKDSKEADKRRVNTKEWKEGERVAIFVKQINKWCPGRVIKYTSDREGRMKLQILFQYAVGSSKKRARVTLGNKSLGLVRKAEEIKLATQAPPPTPSAKNYTPCDSTGPNLARKIKFEDFEEDCVVGAIGSQASVMSLGSNSSVLVNTKKQPGVKRPVDTSKSDIAGALYPNQVKKRKYKILVVGNSKCGKTSIINRYVRDYFTDDYKYTIGCDYSQKEIVDPKTGIVASLRLWDIAGQDRFIQMNRPFFRNAVAAVVVCDVARKASIDAACEWKAELDRCLSPASSGYRVPMILIANKVDTLRDVHESFVIGAYVQKTALSMHFDGWFIGSAKNNEKITEAIDFLVQKIHEEQQKKSEKGCTDRTSSRANTITLKDNCPSKYPLNLDKDKNGCLIG